MKIKTDTKLHALTGEEIKDDNKKPVTVGQMVSSALAIVNNPNPHRCFILAKQFATEKEVELKSEDVVFIKKILEETKLSAIISGQIIDLLEK